jgi:ferritin-like metal-binding protein YciE
MATPVIDTQDNRQRVAARALVAQYLTEAHATETALVTTLQTHIAMTPAGDYRGLLEGHLAETRDHAEALQRRLGELRAQGSIVAATLGLAETVVGQAMAFAKGPIDLLRGATGEEKLLKNAKDEVASEALEIATYDALEAAANAVGDRDTAELAARHREQEERMLSELRAIIPSLTEATVLARVTGRGTYDPSRTGAAEAVRAAGRQMRRARRGASAPATPAPEAPAADATAEAQEAPPLEGYEKLTAAQVVARLSELSPEQLRAITSYERAHRNRRTVLDRADQLIAAKNGNAA